jgi:23S rRNA (adenine2030-N6)-methyltransferase
MLSYQHAYHAGNLADIHKHGALCVLLSRMREKPRPITYMETHAGRGLYDLSAPEALKTGEASLGIIKHLNAGIPPKGHPYRTAIEQTRARHGETFYPGSPLIARSILGADDPMHLMELHPAEFDGLRQVMRDPQNGGGAHLHFRDGFEGVLAISPPPPGHPRRGLVFIDPSYEVKSEYRVCAEFVLELHQKWPEAVIVLWYPVLEAGLHEAMIETLQGAGLKNLSRREVRFPAPKPDPRKPQRKGILGSGLILVNAPYGTEKGLSQVESWLCA